LRAPQSASDLQSVEGKLLMKENDERMVLVSGGVRPPWAVIPESRFRAGWDGLFSGRYPTPHAIGGLAPDGRTPETLCQSCVVSSSSHPLLYWSPPVVPNGQTSFSSSRMITRSTHSPVTGPRLIRRRIWIGSPGRGCDSPIPS
jgi:hypothetical protein